MTLRRRRHVDLSNNTHDVIEDPRRHWRNRVNPYYTYVVSDIFIPPPDTTAWSPDSTGQILLVFYEIYCVGYSARLPKWKILFPLASYLFSYGP
jgi:hypothetical protein